jgi:hypothetical protein
VANARVTQVAVAVLVASDTRAARVTEVGVGSLNMADTRAARVTDLGVGVLIKGINAALVTQVAVQVIVREVKGRSYGYIID